MEETTEETIARSAAIAAKDKRNYAALNRMEDWIRMRGLTLFMAEMAGAEHPVTLLLQKEQDRRFPECKEYNSFLKEGE